MADRLGLLSSDATVISVAGTNGKGSCVRALELLLLASGHSVGAYTSPHIHTYNERVRLNGHCANDDVFIEAFEAIDVARKDISLTYFEFGTLAALYILKASGSKYWLLEVGLGGRLDAVNVVDADVAVITSIGLDHCDWLGDSIEKIGFEKAGICRPNKPLVCAMEVLPLSVQDHAAKLGCPVFSLNGAFGYRDKCGDFQFWWATNTQAGAQSSQLLFGAVALAPHSVAAAVQTLALIGVEPNNAWHGTLKKALPGRLQRKRYKTFDCVLDVAHNPPALEYLVQWLGQEKTNVVILGMMADKDLAASVKALAPVVRSWVLMPLEGIERAASTDQLEVAVKQATPAASVIKAVTPSQALSLACQKAVLTHSEGEPAGSSTVNIVVTGSFYTVGAIDAVMGL